MFSITLTKGTSVIYNPMSILSKSITAISNIDMMTTYYYVVIITALKPNRGQIRCEKKDDQFRQIEYKIFQFLACY